MSDLHLHVKTEYFEAIKRGEKTEEYRLVNEYWLTRLARITYVDARLVPSQLIAGIVIHNAYRFAAPENIIKFPWRGWTLELITHPHFANKPALVFAIKLENKTMTPEERITNLEARLALAEARLATLEKNKLTITYTTFSDPFIRDGNRITYQENTTV
jgi:hypothetical protein